MDARRPGLDLHGEMRLPGARHRRVGFIQTNGKKREDPLFEEFPMIGCNGLTLDRQGRLVIATWRAAQSTASSTMASAPCWPKVPRQALRRTNDVIVKKDGTVYFTDGFGGLRGREKDPKREIFANGVYMLRTRGLAGHRPTSRTPTGSRLAGRKDFSMPTAAATLRQALRRAGGPDPAERKMLST